MRKWDVAMVEGWEVSIPADIEPDTHWSVPYRPGTPDGQMTPCESAEGPITLRARDWVASKWAADGSVCYGTITRPDGWVATVRLIPLDKLGQARLALRG